MGMVGEIDQAKKNREGKAYGRRGDGWKKVTHDYIYHNVVDDDLKNYISIIKQHYNYKTTLLV